MVEDNHNNAADQKTWPEKKEANSLIKAAFEHYQLHTEVVGKKLSHAQEATAQSLGEADEPQQKALSDYNTAWNSIITLFGTCGLTQDDLFEIEKVLDKLSGPVRTHFERLIELDQALQTMMITLEKMDFDATIAKINTVQRRDNPLSGLGPDEYEPDMEQDDQAVTALRIMPKKGLI